VKDIVLNPGDTLVVQANVREHPHEYYQSLYNSLRRAIGPNHEIIFVDNSVDFSKIKVNGRRDEEAIAAYGDRDEVERQARDRPYHFRVMRIDEIKD
jgi:hypothetical protein